MAEGCVYFIRAGRTANVKIGYARVVSQMAEKFGREKVQFVMYLPPIGPGGRSG